MDDTHIAAFEAGIKLGSLYHQFINMPINASMVDEVEKLIELSVSNQPYVEHVSVAIDREKVLKSRNAFGYTTLKPDMVASIVKVRYKDAYAIAELRYDEKMNYPLMRLIEVGKV